MQSYTELERQQAKETMEKDPALAWFRGTPIFEEAPMRLEDFLVQNKPEPLIDKSYRLHREQRKANKKVNMSFNMLTFAIKQQVSADKQGEKYGIMD